MRQPKARRPGPPDDRVPADCEVPTRRRVSASAPDRVPDALPASDPAPCPTGPCATVVDLDALREFPEPGDPRRRAGNSLRISGTWAVGTLAAGLSQIGEQYAAAVRTLAGSLGSLSGCLPGVPNFSALASPRLFDAPWFSDVLRTLERRVDAFDALLVALDWPPLAHLPIPDAHAITEEHAAGQLSPQDVGALFLRAYDGRVLDAMVAAWAAHPWLAHRLPILTEGVACYRDGRFYAAVSTLLPQVEGVAADALGRSPNAQNDAGSFFRDATLPRAARAYYTGPLHATYRGPQTVALATSRHAVLHGGATDFGTPEIALRAVLMTDAVIDAAADYRRGKAPPGSAADSPARTSG